MRRINIPNGGWILLAAAAIPILFQAARPLAKKLGEGMRDLGEKIVESTKDEPKETATPEPQPKTSARKPRVRKKKPEDAA